MRREASGNGSVVNISSVTSLASAPLLAHYGAANAAVNSLTKTLAVEWAPINIRVNSLVPGWIDTDLTDFLRSDDSIEDSLLGDVPIKRWGTAREIAEPAVFLVSDAASFITG